MANLTAGQETPMAVDYSELALAMTASTTIYQGGAVGVVSGTGTALPLDTTTATHLFVGIATASKTSASSGTTLITVKRRGLFKAMATNGIAIAQKNVGQDVYWFDDHTVSLNAFTGGQKAGKVAKIDSNGDAWISMDSACN